MEHPSIFYFFEDIEDPGIDQVKTSNWIETIIHNHEFKLTGLNFVFCSDSYLLSINQEYLQHDYFTDIITFDLAEEPDQIEGEIYISLDRVDENARQNETDTQQELLRVIIHGVLHLIGYNDKTDEEKKLMRSKENECIADYH
jgi:rRNA maturation RNase YbeY